MTDDLVKRAQAQFPAGAPLPDLTPDVSDEVLCMTILRAGAVVVAEHQVAVTKSFEALLRKPGSPEQRLRAYHDGFQQRSKAAAAQAGSVDRSPAWWGAAVSLLREALVAIRWFGAEVARIDSRSPEQVAREVEADRMTVHHRQEATRMAAAMSANAHLVRAPGAIAGDIIAGLGARGITLSVGDGGGIRATLADRLTVADRAQLAANKGAIIAALSATECVA